MFLDGRGASMPVVVEFGLFGVRRSRPEGGSGSEFKSEEVDGAGEESAGS
jgi:hypothetical protein